ncbi:hypothetical protein Cpa01nite_10830 [Cellulomonas pakistanensis]|uniref:Uncharacterized protein n=2 Tax=Cellulomonas pakistanensis TaxID=992287 RepID=A0A919PCH4_9CELL|nr:hypothetical protein Cpa01nite_10830 [Cellulomonas pakistanensis]
MGRVVAVLIGVAVLVLQVWLTLYAQVVLAYEAALVLVAMLGIGLRAFARSRRRAQRVDGARWPAADGIPVPQPTVLLGGPVLPSVDVGSGLPPVAAQVHDRVRDDPLGGRRARPVG